MSGLKVGLEWAAVLTVPEAAGPIKSYSPELMVHPSLKPEFSKDDAEALVGKMNGVVIGNGLGLDDAILNTTAKYISLIRAKHLPLIVDGDGVTLVSRDVELVKGNREVILTPNAMEFRRLWEAVFKGTERAKPPPFNVEFDQESKKLLQAAEIHGTSLEDMKEGREGFVQFDVSHPLVKDTADLARQLGGVTIVRKGQSDIISDGSVAISTALPSSLKRCSGQGDVMAGVISAFQIWAQQQGEKRKESDKHKLPPLVVAAFGGCLVTRLAARDAFSQKGRALLAADVMDTVPHVAAGLFPVEKSQGSIFSGL